MSLKSCLFQVGSVAAGAFVAGGLAQAAGAAPIAIANPGFGQITDPGTGDPISLFAGDYTSGMANTVVNQFRQNQPAVVAGWVAEGQDFAEGVENSGNFLPGGTHAFLNPNGAFEQSLGAPVEAGTYVLTVQVGDRSDRTFAAPIMELFDASTGNALVPTVSVNPDPPDGGYAQWSQTYVVPAGLPNTDIGVRFVSGGDESHLDNVALDFTPIPEPGSLVLLGLGAAGLLGRRRGRT
jgi:hypothetical protein